MRNALKAILKYLFGVLLPLAVVLLFIEIADTIEDTTDADVIGETIPQRFTTIISMNSELAKFLMGLSTALIGGVGYYLRGKKEDYPPLNHYSVSAISGALLASVFSIFFGYLIIVKMRNQLASNIFLPKSVELNWPANAQFATFIAALVWLSLLILERELARVRQQQKGDVPAGSTIAAVSVTWLGQPSALPAEPDRGAEEATPPPLPS